MYLFENALNCNIKETIAENNSCPTYHEILNSQVDTFTAVYKKLTGRDVTFEFPEPYL